jgi:hypothetical protein
MRIYTFHMIPGATTLGDAVAVKEGFSWFAFLFDILWVLYHRLWLWAAAIVAVWVLLDLAALYGVIDSQTLTVAIIGFKVWIGFSGNDWRRNKLDRAGYLLAGIAAGRDQETADQRFYDSVLTRRAAANGP